MTREELKKYVGWDIDTWSIGLQYIIGKCKFSLPPSAKALELGSHYGGISVCLVKELGCNTVCSDLENPCEKVLEVHPEMQTNSLMTFDDVDGLKIKYHDASFDLIIFKSVLGCINSKEQQQCFINEIYRVLKPGGRFCFLENCKASWLHCFARKQFVSWGKSWRYVSFEEMRNLLSVFKSYEILSNGFLTAFVRSTKCKRIVYWLDRQIIFCIPKTCRYVIYGIAVK
jgi:ubiquinone/menaquinone biosynthesis C-methylase UbiE